MFTALRKPCCSPAYLGPRRDSIGVIVYYTESRNSAFTESRAARRRHVRDGSCCEAACHGKRCKNRGGETYVTVRGGILYVWPFPRRSPRALGAACIVSAWFGGTILSSSPCEQETRVKVSSPKC
jgi:hypothetical protein